MRGKEQNSRENFAVSSAWIGVATTLLKRSPQRSIMRSSLTADANNSWEDDRVFFVGNGGRIS